jgi:glycerol-3-phosphate dehydrogenase (NAD(P)+)
MKDSHVSQSATPDASRAPAPESAPVAAPVAVLGGGAWGTALAQVAASAGHDVSLWALEHEVVDGINQRHENALFLPGQPLSPSIRATDDLAGLAGAQAILAVVPAQHMRAVLGRLAPHVAPGTPVVLCSKGIERGSLKLMGEVLAEEIPAATVAVLSGPSFAKDVAAGLPTAVTLACTDPQAGARVAGLIGIAHFRPYLATDVVGAEIGGSVKNVLAIACGMAEGRGLGESARAALITRGFAEMRRLGVALGADPATLAGLCGLGDLVLTCSSRTSRNFSLGLALGQGQTVEQALAGKLSVAEGAGTAPALAQLAGRLGVDMPISLAVDAILAGRLGVGDAMAALLARPLRAEHD